MFMSYEYLEEIENEHKEFVLDIFDIVESLLNENDLFIENFEPRGPYGSYYGEIIHPDFRVIGQLRISDHYASNDSEYNIDILTHGHNDPKVETNDFINQWKEWKKEYFESLKKSPKIEDMKNLEFIKATKDTSPDYKYEMKEVQLFNEEEGKVEIWKNILPFSKLEPFYEGSYFLNIDGKLYEEE